MNRPFQAWLNGEFLSQEELRLPVHDAGFVMGATVTDMLRTFRHKPCCLDLHLQRFLHNCKECRIPIEYGYTEIQKIVEELIRRNSTQLAIHEDLATVLFATPGPIGFYLSDPGTLVGQKPTLGIHTFILPLERFRQWYHHGVDLLIPSVRQPSSNTISPLIKQRSRMHWWIAEQEVKEKNPAAIALLLDQEGNFTETASSNLVLVKNAEKTVENWVFHTPKSASVLDGITKNLLRDFAQGNSIPWLERDISNGDIHPDLAGILTGTTFCFASIKSIGGIPLRNANNILNLVALWWKERFGMDWREQIPNIV